MLRKMIYASVAVVALGALAATPAFAQPGHTFGGHRHYNVQYRIPEWRERTFYSPGAAHEFAVSKRRQGFEAFVDRERGHYDVRFRMRDWHNFRTVESDRAAHELERLLERRGYDARVIHH